MTLTQETPREKNLQNGCQAVNDLGIAADGNNFTVDGLMFTILPWWDGPVLLKEIEKQIAKDAATDKTRWIWIYHTPPDNSPTSWDGKKYNGDDNLVKWVKHYKPDAVLSGHCHLSPFKIDGSWVDRLDSTWVFNPGMQIGPFPSHIILEINLNKAAWFSISKVEQQVDLSKDLIRPVQRTYTNAKVDLILAFIPIRTKLYHVSSSWL